MVIFQELEYLTIVKSEDVVLWTLLQFKTDFTKWQFLKKFMVY